MNDATNTPVDVFVIGGGVNGTGIARDAVGRGHTVMLAEMHDLASAHPEKVKELAAKWQAYAERANVLPLGAWRAKARN